MGIQVIPLLERHRFFAAMSECASGLQPGEFIGLLIVDINDFKRFNRCFGYGVGDLILATTHSRLKSIFEHAIIYRVGDNEFGVILPHLNSPAQTAIAAQKILDAVEPKYQLPDRELKITVSIGIGYGSPSEGSEPQMLLQQSERSLFYTKKVNKPFCLEIPKDDQELINFFDLESDLIEAMYAGDLSLHYQPKIDLETNKPVAAEALLRWHHPDHGDIKPHVIVGLANRLGKELELGKWILNTALREFSTLDNELEKVGVAVNVPSSLIHSHDFYNMVVIALRLWGVPPTRLTLEIDEDAIIEGKEYGLDTLGRLRADGVRISIDDFGTGYSSLNYFRSIPADEIKIDQSFIGNMLSNGEDRKVVKLCLDIAHHFGLDVVAEGVENDAVANALGEMNCSYAQGYCYSEPMRIDTLKSWLKNYRH